MNSLMDLTELHRELDSLFAQHQRHVVRMEWWQALLALNVFSRKIALRMTCEEKLLLPLYESRIGEPPGGAARLFKAEHRKIRRHLDEFRAALRRHIRIRSTDVLDVIELIEAEAQFKQLAIHHDQRERSFLYQRLDERASPGEVLDLLHAIETASASAPMRPAEAARKSRRSWR
jgi:hypothetical protein